MRTTLTRFEPFHGVSSLQGQINRLFNEAFDWPSDEANLTTWAPAVDIYETEHNSSSRPIPRTSSPKTWPFVSRTTS